jgi:hypothetical protein
MDIFAYVSLGLCGAVALAWGIAYLIVLSRDLGASILVGCGLLLLAACGIVSAIWLIGAKLI